MRQGSKTFLKIAPNMNPRNIFNDSAVTSSMASFMALEELCANQSLSPRQTEAVFEASQRLQRKQNGQHTGTENVCLELITSLCRRVPCCNHF